MNAGFLARRGVIIRHPVDFWPERCALGGATLPFVANNYGFAMLYNNDPLGRRLRIYGFSSSGGNPQAQPGIALLQGTQGTLAMNGQSMVTDIGQLAGQIFSGYTVTRFGTPFFSAQFGLEDNGVGFAPLLVLAAKTSLVCFSDDVNTTVWIEFLWMVD